MPATYEPIATYTCPDATQRTITFTSIPSTYTDLRVIFVGRTEVSGTGGYSGFSVRFNGSTSGYSLTEIEGNGTSALSWRETSQTYFYAGTLNYEGSPNSFITLDIFNYAGSTNKTTLCSASYDRNGSGSTKRTVALWSNTAAITSIAFDTDGFGVQTGRDFMTGSTFTLYGIKAA